LEAALSEALEPNRGPYPITSLKLKMNKADGCCSCLREMSTYRFSYSKFTPKRLFQPELVNDSLQELRLKLMEAQMKAREEHGF